MNKLTEKIIKEFPIPEAIEELNISSIKRKYDHIFSDSTSQFILCEVKTKEGIIKKEFDVGTSLEILSGWTFGVEKRAEQTILDLQKHYIDQGLRNISINYIEDTEE
jgi:hypothetical protein